jgi:hypothetical protein
MENRMIMINTNKHTDMCEKKSIEQCFKCKEFLNCPQVEGEEKQELTKMLFLKVMEYDKKDFNDKFNQAYYKSWKEAYEFLEQYDFNHEIAQDAIMLIFDKLKMTKLNLITDVYTSLLENGLLDLEEHKKE